MVTTSKIGIRGGKELERALRDLPGAMGKNVMKAALREGANVIKEDGNRRVGDRALRVINRRGTKDMVMVSVILRARKWYLRFFEFGAGPHQIFTAKGKDARKKKPGRIPEYIGRQPKVLAEGGGGTVFGTVINHPGMAARPFLRPALDANVGKVIERIGEALGRRIATAARKVNSGAVNARTGRKVK